MKSSNYLRACFSRTRRAVSARHSTFAKAAALCEGGPRLASILGLALTLTLGTALPVAAQTVIAGGGNYISGTTFFLGTHTGSTSGFKLVYDDAASDALTFHTNRLASWLWENFDGTTTWQSMRLDAANNLILYNGTNEGVKLNPVAKTLTLGGSSGAVLTASGTALSINGAFTVAGALTGSSLNNTPIGATTPSTGAFTSLTTTGNFGVGTGTTAPLVKFDVKLATNQHVGIYNNGGVTTLAGLNDAGNLANLKLEGSPLAFGGAGGVEHLRIDASGNVGIGTTTPQAKFQLVGGNLFVNAVNDATGGFYYGGATNGLVIGNYATSPWPGTNGLFVGGNSVLMGNVGIGTAAPASALEVNGDIIAHAQGSGQVLKIYGRSSDNYAWAPLTLTNNGSAYMGGIGYQPTTASMYVGAGLSPSMTWLSNGNVGINTTGPAAKLDIYNGGSGGPLALNVNGSGATVQVTTSYPAITATGTNYYRNIGFYSYNLPISAGVTDSGYRIGEDVENFVTDPNFLGTLSFQYGLWARVGSYAGGNGTIQNSYGVYIENLDGPATIGNKYGLFQSNSTAKNYFAGNVGIGTTSPGAMAEIYRASGAATELRLNTGFPGGNAVDLNPFITGVNNGGFELAVAGTRRLVIDPTGNVGIGTTTPGAKLEVRGDIRSYLDGADSVSGQLYFANSANSRAWNWQLTANGSSALWGYDGTAWGEKMRVAPNGNVGIGTIDPGAYKLAVKGSIHAQEVVVDNTNWADYVFDSNYRLAPLSEVEKHIKAEKHLPGIPSAQEIAEHGVSMGDMQSKLLSKIEELTLHMIQQEKLMTAQQNEIATLRQQVSELKAAQP